jgi:hypothetical protein
LCTCFNACFCAPFFWIKIDISNVIISYIFIHYLVFLMYLFDIISHLLRGFDWLSLQLACISRCYF